VMRVVPKENESLNETWLSDRDRFSYLGLNHEQRATQPMIKHNGEWQNTDWQTALEATIDGLQAIKTKHGVEQIAGLASPTETLEESYLFQKLLRGLGVENIDHRLRQQDFADQDIEYPHQDWCLADLEASDDIVLIGCHIRSEQPMIAHRIRQAEMMGATITDINFFNSDLLMPVDRHVSVNASEMVLCLSGIAKALISFADEADQTWSELLVNIVPTAVDQTIAMRLANVMKATLLVGALANNHPQAAKIKSLTALIARLSKGQMIVLPTANSTASTLAGVLPQQTVAGKPVEQQGLNAQQMWQQSLRAYVLLGLEPELDCANSATVDYALQQASFVVSMTAYVTDKILATADVILPIASFAETSGTFIGVDEQWQSFKGAVAPQGESRPAWKVLRVLGNLAKVDGFDYVSSQDVRDEVADQLKLAIRKDTTRYMPEDLTVDKGIMLVSEVPMYQVDAVVRRSEALQQTPDNQQASLARMNSVEAEKQGVTEAENITITCGDLSLTVSFKLDNDIANGCVYLATSQLFGADFANVTISIVEASHD